MDSRKILLLHDQEYVQAGTVAEHVAAFARHSAFPLTTVNVHAAWKHAAQGHAPSATAAAATLDTVRGGDFAAVILHYSLFGMDLYYFGAPLLEWLKGFQGLKIAFFQDECLNCGRRFAFIDDYGVDVVYTLVEPRHFRQTWIGRTKAACVLYTIPGFVGRELLESAERLARENPPRSIDVGYRGRRISRLLGEEGQEKHRIGEEFVRLARQHPLGRDLVLDIASEESSRIYGEAWPRFLASCKAVLGVEAGLSVFDLDDAVSTGLARLRALDPNVSEDRLYQDVVLPHEGRLFYRTISPRHFEAAALGACQILFPGTYSGIMEPDVHYLPLAKDFSNLDEVLTRFRDEGERKRLTDNAHHDLIASGRFTYQRFVEDFDIQLRLLL